MNPILKRTISGLTVGAAVIGLFLYCPLIVLPPLLLVISALVQIEFYQMARSYDPVTWYGVLMGSVWITLTAAFPGGCPAFLIGLPAGFLVAFFVLALIVLFRSSYEKPLGTIGVTLLGFLYVPFLLSFFLRIVQLGAPEGYFALPASRAGLYTLLAIVAVAKFSDTGGFALGMACGRHKMCPTISPKKSWEGLVGSMIFSAITACVFLTLARRFDWAASVPAWKALTYPVAAVLGAALAWVATACDLIESRFKRECGVKDSATFMPAGMGGFLDMFDSVLFLPAFIYFLIVFTRF